MQIINEASEMVDVRSLTPHPKNPNVGNADLIAESVVENGFYGAVIAQRSTGHVLVGHHRLQAAQQLGAQEVPVIWVDVDNTRALKIMLSDNATAAAAHREGKALAELLAELNTTDTLTGTGYGAADLDALLAELAAAAPAPEPVEAPEAQEDRAAELQVKWQTERGQLWVIGRHRLLCGDSRVAADVERVLAGQKIAVCVTSPPYAAQREYDEGSGFKPIAPDEYVAWFEAVQDNVSQHLAQYGSFFLNIKEHCEDGERHLYVKDLVVEHVRRWGWRFIDELCWERVGLPGRFRGRFKNGWEPVFHFAKARATDLTFNPYTVGRESDAIPVYKKETNLNPVGSLTGIPVTREEKRKKAAEMEIRSGVALPSNRLPPFSTDGTAHSAAFPVGLPAFFIRAFSNEGDTIYEPFCGSGTTLVAAEREGRQGCGIEISPAYVAIILERLSGMGLTPRLEP